MKPITLAALLASGFAALALAPGCEGDDTPAKFFDATSEGAVDAPDDTPVDSPQPDAETTHAKIIVVHASPDLGPVRFCIGTGLQNDGSDTQIVPIAPQPTTAVGPGAGAVLADLGDLSLRAVKPFAVLASSIGANTATCDALLSGTLTSGTDYFPLPTVKNGTLAASSTHLLALTGCEPAALDSAADTTTCGADWNGSAGNLGVSVLALDRVVANTQRFGAELAHVASPASGVWTSLYGATDVSASLRPFDGGASEPIADSIALGAIAPTSAASLAMPSIDETSLVVSAMNPDGGASPVETSIPLPLVYEATTGQATGEKTYFVAGVNYTFVFVGDPRAPATLDGGAFNGYSLHALAFPNDPPLPP